MICCTSGFRRICMPLVIASSSQHMSCSVYMSLKSAAGVASSAFKKELILQMLPGPAEYLGWPLNPLQKTGSLIKNQTSKIEKCPQNQPGYPLRAAYLSCCLTRLSSTGASWLEGAFINRSRTSPFQNPMCSLATLPMVLRSTSGIARNGLSSRVSSSQIMRKVAPCPEAHRAASAILCRCAWHVKLGLKYFDRCKPSPRKVEMLKSAAAPAKSGPPSLSR